MTDRPNVIVFFTDQQRWDTVGAYGNPLSLTPHLDSMARRGTLFEYAFTPQPVCGPARTALQTGLYPSQVGWASRPYDTGLFNEEEEEVRLPATGPTRSSTRPSATSTAWPGPPSSSSRRCWRMRAESRCHPASRVAGSARAACGTSWPAVRSCRAPRPRGS